MRKTNRKNLKADRQMAAEVASQLSPAEQKATQQVMDEVFRRMKVQFKGRRVSKDLLDEAMANTLADVIAEREAEEKRVMMARARNTTQQPAEHRVLETVGGDEEELVEEPVAARQESAQEETTMKNNFPEVTLVADDDGFFWPTPAYVKGETSVSDDQRLQGEIVSHTSDDDAKAAAATKTYDALMSKLDRDIKAAVNSKPTPQQPQATETPKEESTMNTQDNDTTGSNDSNDNLKNTAAGTNDGAEGTTFWGTLKAKLSAMGEQVMAYADKSVDSAFTTMRRHLNEGRKTRAWVVGIAAFAITIVGLSFFFSFAAGFLLSFGILGLIAYIAVVIAVRVFVAVPAFSMVYNGIEGAVNYVTALFSKPAPTDFATA